jgi:hypothetical protein
MMETNSLQQVEENEVSDKSKEESLESWRSAIIRGTRCLVDNAQFLKDSENDEGEVEAVAVLIVLSSVASADITTGLLR